MIPPASGILCPYMVRAERIANDQNFQTMPTVPTAPIMTNGNAESSPLKGSPIPAGLQGWFVHQPLLEMHLLAEIPRSFALPETCFCAEVPVNVFPKSRFWTMTFWTWIIGFKRVRSQWETPDFCYNLYPSRLWWSAPWQAGQFPISIFLIFWADSEWTLLLLLSPLPNTPFLFSYWGRKENVRKMMKNQGKVMENEEKVKEVKENEWKTKDK